MVIAVESDGIRLWSLDGNRLAQESLLKTYALIALIVASCWLSLHKAPTTADLLAKAAADGDPLASLHFSDGKGRTLDDFPKQSVLVLYFCGHCPTASAYLGNHIKKLYDFIESRKVPVTMVLATPDFPPPEVLALNKNRRYHMDKALWASDPLNHEGISLNNIYQLHYFNGDHLIESNLSWVSSVQEFESAFTTSKANESSFPISLIYGMIAVLALLFLWYFSRPR